MKENKNSITIMYILFALPIPLSLFSWIATIMSVAAIGMTDWSEPGIWLQVIVSLLFYIMAGTYLISYIVGLYLTLKNKAISFVSYLPLIHIGTTFGINHVGTFLSGFFR